MTYTPFVKFCYLPVQFFISFSGNILGEVFLLRLYIAVREMFRFGKEMAVFFIIIIK